MEEPEKNNDPGIHNVWDIFSRNKFHAYLDGLTYAEQNYFLNICYNKHYYWIFFLPLPKHAHILVLEESPGLVSMLLLFMGHNVVAVNNNNEKYEFWDKEKFTANESYVEKNCDISLVLEDNSAKYDAIIINDLVRINCFANNKNKKISDMLGDLTAALNTDGALWIGGDNPNYFKNYYNKENSKHGDKITWPLVLSELVRIGLKLAEFHELKPYYNAPEKVTFLTPNKKKKAGGIKEHIKNSLPKRIREKYFSPAYGALFSLNYESAHSSFIKKLGNKLLGSNCSLESIYLGNPDTIILKFVNCERSLIARVPFTLEAKLRCDRSQKALESLSWFMYDKVKLTPVAEKKLKLDGMHVYIESAIFGEAIGSPACRGKNYINNATEMVTVLHLESQNNTVIGEEVFDGLIGTLIGKLASNLPPSYAEKIKWLSEYFRNSFLNKSIPLVFNHGDYKLENILVQNGDCSIIGVIDWDLSVENGMPFIDLIHLLAYEKCDKGSQSIDEIIMKKWVPGKQCLEKDDRILVDQYLSALKIPNDLFKPLVGYYWLDNVAKRYSTNGKYFSEEFIENFVLPVFEEVKYRSNGEMQATNR